MAIDDAVYFNSAGDHMKLRQKHESYRELAECCGTCRHGVYHVDYETVYGPYCDLVCGVIYRQLDRPTVEFFGKEVPVIECTKQGERLDKVARVREQGWCQKWESEPKVNA